MPLHPELELDPVASPTRLWRDPAFPFVRFLEAHHEVLRAEADALEPEDFVDWPQRSGYLGVWRVFCFLSRDPAWMLARTCVRNARRVPETVRLLRRIPGLARAGLSLLMPGSHIGAHRDGRDGDQDLLRCHLGLRSNPRAVLRVDGVTVPCVAGRCVVFDGQALHEAANLGETPRLACLLDVDRAALEHEVPGWLEAV